MNNLLNTVSNRYAVGSLMLGELEDVDYSAAYG